MKIRYSLLAAALLVPAYAGTATPLVEVTEAAPAAKRLSGSITLGYDSNYTGRGYVVSHSVAEGDSVFYGAVKLNYDLGKPGQWTLGSTVAYQVPTSGHRLYGGGVKLSQATPLAPGVVAPAGTRVPIGDKNIENQFSLITQANYASTTGLWNISLGHHFTHGGLLGVMAKHYRDQGASVVNEVFIAPEWTPYKWLSVGVKTSYSFQGITGWWFEPYVTVKAPIIGTPEDIKLLGVVTLGMSATADYFADPYNACGNGSQAFWVKFSTPWFVRDNLIITPSISFNWLGKGGLDANKRAEARPLDNSAVPFRNFGVVAGISATYTF